MKESADHYFDAANACELEGNWAEANSHYTRAIALCPELVDARENRAANWIELREYANAISDYEVVIRTRPHSAAPHKNLAQLYLEADDPEYADPELAVRHAREACRITKNNCYESLALYARACHARREFRRAVRFQQLAVDAATELRTCSSADRVDQMNAEIMLSELEERLDNFRLELQEHEGRSNSSFPQRIRSWLKLRGVR